MSMHQNLRPITMSFWNELVPELIKLATTVNTPPIHSHSASHHGDHDRLASRDLDTTAEDLSVGLYKSLSLSLIVLSIVLLVITCFLSCKYNKSKQHHVLNTTLFVKALPSKSVV